MFEAGFPARARLVNLAYKVSIRSLRHYGSCRQNTSILSVCKASDAERKNELLKRERSCTTVSIPANEARQY